MMGTERGVLFHASAPVLREAHQLNAYAFVYACCRWASFITT